MSISKNRLKHASTCLNFRVRRTARALNRHYDEALRPAGLGATQFNLLVPLAIAERLTVTRFAELMEMERSALARNLRILERQRLVSIRPGADRRTRVVTLTAMGRRKLGQALPLWDQAQSRVLAGLSTTTLKQLGEALDALRATVDRAD